MARGLELGQRATPRVQPRRGPSATRGAQRDACAARPQRVRGPSTTRQRGPARVALARHAVPSARSSTPRRARLPPVYSMRSDRVIYINTWKLDLEIVYVSYFM
jgi:hypothetical protein